MGWLFDSESKFKQWRLLLFSLFVCCFWCLLIGFALIQQADSNKRTQSYAQSLVRLSVNLVTLPAYLSNKISLQSLVNDLSQHYGVVRVVVYDVNHRVVAEKSSIQFREGYHKEFSSPIHFGGDYFGTLALTFNVNSSWNYWLIWGLIVGFIIHMCSLFVLIFASKRVKPFESKGCVYPSSNSAIRVSIKPLFVSQIERSKNEFNDTYEEFKTTLNRIVVLYSGEVIESTPHRIEILFEHFSDSQNAFNALCFCYLLLLITNPEKSMIRFSALVMNQRDSLYSCFTKHYDLEDIACFDEKLSGFIGFNNTLLADSDLGCRLITGPSRSDGWSHLLGFENNYQKLLKNQADQLKSIDMEET